MTEHLSQEEATAAIAAIKALRDGKGNEEGEDFKNWFDSAFPPILKDFAASTTSKITVEQDARGDIRLHLPAAAVLILLRIRGGCI